MLSRLSISILTILLWINSSIADEMIVYGKGQYEIWGGYEEWVSYDIPINPNGYRKIGEGNDVVNLEINEDFHFIIIGGISFSLDAVYFDGRYIEDSSGGLFGRLYPLGTGNSSDWTDYIGPPDNNYVVVGSECNGCTGFNGFLFFGLKNNWRDNENGGCKESNISPCRDQRLGNLYKFGNPPTPTVFDGGPDDDEFLNYDPTKYDTYKKFMHNRPITVAISKDANINNSDRLELSEIIFTTWAKYWKDYDGFPFESYTVVIGNNLKYGYAGAFGKGFEYEIKSYPLPVNEIVHEIAHAWCGCAFIQAGGRTWLKEGLTVYYEKRQELDRFCSVMNRNYGYYLDLVANGLDKPIGDIGYSDPGYLDNGDHYIAGIKGGLVAYFLDKELSKTGHHIGELARRLYHEYGTKSFVDIDSHPTNDDILSILNEISGKDFTGFFHKYIYGTEKLPKDDNDFIWICHDKQFKSLPSVRLLLSD